jgi:hypothetical protein
MLARASRRTEQVAIGPSRTGAGRRRRSQIVADRRGSSQAIAGRRRPSQTTAHRSSQAMLGPCASRRVCLNVGFSPRRRSDGKGCSATARDGPRRPATVIDDLRRPATACEGGFRHVLPVSCAARDARRQAIAALALLDTAWTPPGHRLDTSRMPPPIAEGRSRSVEAAGRRRWPSSALAGPRQALPSLTKR